MNLRPRLPLPCPVGDFSKEISAINIEIEMIWSRFGSEIETISRLQPMAVRNKLIATRTAETVEAELRLDKVRRSLIDRTCCDEVI